MSTVVPKSGHVPDGPVTQRQIVVFLLGDEEYAVPITSVQEIILYTPPRPMPHAAEGIEGLINLRGRIIPVVDLRRLLGSPGERAESSRIVVVESGDAAVGLEVDDVAEVLTVSDSDCERPPDGAGAGDMIEAVVKLDGRLLVILDLDHLLRSGVRW